MYLARRGSRAGVTHYLTALPPNRELRDFAFGLFSIISFPTRDEPTVSETETSFTCSPNTQGTGNQTSRWWNKLQWTLTMDTNTQPRKTPSQARVPNVELREPAEVRLPEEVARGAVRQQRRRRDAKVVQAEHLDDVPDAALRRHRRRGPALALPLAVAAAVALE